MIRGVHHRVEHDGTAYVEVVGDQGTIAAIAEDLTSRMFGQPEPITAGRRALSIVDLSPLPGGAIVEARRFPVSDHRFNARRTRWTKIDMGRHAGRWRLLDAVWNAPGVSCETLVAKYGPVLEADRSDDAATVDGTPDDG